MRRKNVGSLAIVLESFGAFTHWNETGSAASSKVSVFEGQKRQSSVNNRFTFLQLPHQAQSEILV